MVKTVADNKGDDDSKIAFIFACPGKKEAEGGKPCFAVTGDNLNILLVKLNEIDSDIFYSTDRYKYPIINSCTTVYPNSNNLKKTQPSFSEIDKDDNLERIYEGVKGKEYVICFGRCAEHAVNSVMKKHPDLKFEKIKSDHLSLSNLNRKYKSEKKKPYDKRKDRIEKASKTIISYFEEKK